MSEDKNKEGFGWDDSIDPNQQQRVLLPAGPAMFSVQELKRERKEFGKFGVQNIAVVVMLVSTMETGFDTQEVQVNLPLVHALKWKITNFFTAIGQRKHGDEGEFVPNWSKVVGATGNCVLEHREVTSKKGTKYTVADVKEFTAPEQTDDNLKF